MRILRIVFVNSKRAVLLIIKLVTKYMKSPNVTEETKIIPTEKAVIAEIYCSKNLIVRNMVTAARPGLAIGAMISKTENCMIGMITIKYTIEDSTQGIATA